MTRRSTDSAGSTSRRSSIANRVLSEISNTTSNRSSNASSISPGVKRLSTGQRVSSAIQHFQRITSGSSASAQSFTASSYPSISRPFQVERNGVLLDQEQHPSPTDSYHSSMLPPTVHENNDDEYEDDTDHTSYSRRASTSIRSNRFSTAPTEVDSINANRYSTASAYGEPAVYHPSSSDSAQNSQFQLSSSPTKSSSSDDTGYEPHAAADKRVSQLSTCTTGSSASSRGHKHKTHVGPWRLGRTLGRGSSGRVRLAKHSKTGKLAAVKIVPKSASFEDPANPESQARGKDAAGLPYGIEREVIIMKLIEHPNVMGLYDVWENHGELYLILEYVEGGELFDYLIRKGRLDEREAVHYFRQIILGVDYCHKFNICHRDLKPENLLLDKHHNIKIADFGMAALEATGKMLETSCGSPHYASPEIVAGKTYHGSQSDIWSCGVILFALLTGHLPFDDENIRNLLMKVQTGKFQMPSDLSIHAKDLIWRILKINPEDRITAEEILSHPLLRKYPSKDANANISRAPTVPVHHPINSREEVDVEIVKNLQTLWHGEDREVIIDRLLSPELNPEKTFYCLLMKYRHDHIDDSSSAENTPRTSPHQNRRKQSIGNNAMVKQPAKPAAALQRQTTPTRVSRHKKTASKGSVRSIASSHRKRGVDFSHVSKKVQGSTSTPSIKSQNSIQRRQQQPEYEPPLPESSSMLIAAIDQLSQSMAREPSSISAAKEQSRSIINAQRPQVDQNRVPVPGPVPRTAIPRRNPPPMLETKKKPMVLEDYANLSSPVEQIPGLRLDYSVRSAKEQKSRPGTAATLPEDDEVRKISAEFAASLCETMFNFGGPSTRNVSDSSTESQPRTVSTSSEASTASTAPTSVGGRTPVMADAEFGKDTTGPLRLKFEPIKSTVHVSNSSKDEWVHEFERYLVDNNRVSLDNVDNSKKYNNRNAGPARVPQKYGVSSLLIDDKNDVPPRPPPHTVKRNSASIERFLDAEEEDGMASFAAEVEHLLNTPPVLKRQSLTLKAREAGNEALVSRKTESRPSDSSYIVSSITSPTPRQRSHNRNQTEASRLRISKIVANDSFYGTVNVERDECKTERRYLSLGEEPELEAHFEARKVSGQSMESNASTGTTIRHPVGERSQYSNRMSMGGEEEDDITETVTLRPKMHSVRESAAGSYKSNNRVSVISQSSVRHQYGRPSTSASMTRGGSRTFHRPTVSIITTADDNKPERPISSMLIDSSAAPAESNPKRKQEPLSAVMTTSEQSQKQQSDEPESTRWVRFHKSLLPKRKAPAPPSAGGARSSTNFMGRKKSTRSAARSSSKKRKTQRESDLFEGVVPTPYTSHSRPKRSWFSKILDSIA